ncbi:hypothetical protein VV38_13820 [Clavibacter nebraskensis]|uniref:Uncharacterized protein n=1 Tax=Clavibacter nebraskensis TaxID=31963 RepID=A0A399Q6S9_9MICO|nr:hypothetical protein VV38_13820 [Clavibacter nebraskensis]OAH19697.1 hypothetical protein A3Q38_07230 [Clavibacter nebraskensis]RIJ14191.1 hypothetical protein DZF97_06055 [Clavibacter nebraskensis]
MSVPTAHLVAGGPEDDAAFIALRDLAKVLEAHPDARVVGGHMVGLITAAFPSPGFVERRTGDADAGIPVELADDGSVHAALIAAGYRDVAGNRYVLGQDEPMPTIDLLVPTLTGRFSDALHGGRRLDAMPGLHLAVASPLHLDASLLLQDGTELSTSVVVPGLEAAVVLKAYAWRGRGGQTVKDVTDLSNLLHVRERHGDAAGPWALGQPGLIGARRDAAQHLHALADRLAGRSARQLAIDPRRLAVLIRRHVARP